MSAGNDHACSGIVADGIEMTGFPQDIILNQDERGRGRERG
jgi:hypothetical protein